MISRGFDVFLFVLKSSYYKYRTCLFILQIILFLNHFLQYLTLINYPARRQDMQDSQLIRGYEQKIISISKQLEATKSEKNEIIIDYQRVKRLLQESNKDLQLKAEEVLKKQRIIAKLTNQKSELQSVLGSSQRHRKLLFDTLYTQNPRREYQNFEKSQELFDRIRILKSQVKEATISDLKEVINQKNNELTKIWKQFNKLLKDHLSSVNEYQTKIQVLNQENSVLKKNFKVMEDKMNQKEEGNHEILAMTKKTLEQRIGLLIQKLKLDEQKNVEMAKMIQSQKQQIKVLKSRLEVKEAFKIQNTPTVDEYLLLIQEKKRLQKELQTSVNRYQDVLVKFPSIAQNEERVAEIVRMHGQIHVMETELQKKRNQAQIYKKKFDEIYNQSLKQKKQLYEVRSDWQTSQGNYKSVIQKFKQFFIMVNPHYTTYQFDQLFLSQSETALLKRGKTKAGGNINSKDNSKKEILSLEQKLAKANTQIQIKNGQLQKLNSIIDKNNQKITILQEAIKQLSKKLQGIEQNGNTASSTSNKHKFFASVLQSYTKIQNERNQLIKDIKAKERKILELTMEVNFYETISISRKQKNEDQLQKYFSTPNFVMVEINKDVNAVNKKIYELEDQIREQYRKQELTIQLIKSEYEKEINRLKQRIDKMEEEKRYYIPSNAPDIIQIHRQESVQDNLQGIELGSVLEMEDHIGKQEMEEGTNVLSAESIQQMNKLLTGHESNMKNLIQAFLILKEKYSKVEEKLKSVSAEQQISQIKNLLSQHVKEINLLKTRLTQADRNLTILQQEVSLKNIEIQNLKQASSKQMQFLKNTIQHLQKQVQSQKEECWLESPIDWTKKSSKEFFPEQLQYFVEIITQLQQKLKQSKLNEQNIKNSSFKLNMQNLEIKESQPYSQYLNQNLAELVQSGQLVALIQCFNNYLDKNNDNH